MAENKFHIVGILLQADTQNYIICNIQSGKLNVVTEELIIKNKKSMYGISIEDNKIKFEDGAESCMPMYAPVKNSDYYACIKNRDRIVVLSKMGTNYNVSRANKKKLLPVATYDNKVIQIGIMVGTISEDVIIRLHKEYSEEFGRTPFFNITVSDELVKVRNSDYPLIDLAVSKTAEFEGKDAYEGTKNVVVSIKPEDKERHLKKLRSLSYADIFNKWLYMFRYRPDTLQRVWQNVYGLNVKASYSYAKECRIMREELIYPQVPYAQKLYETLGNFLKKYPITYDKAEMRYNNKCVYIESSKEHGSILWELYLEYLFYVTLLLCVDKKLSVAKRNIRFYRNEQEALFTAYFFVDVDIINIVCQIVPEIKGILCSTYRLLVMRHIRINELRAELNNNPEQSENKIRAINEQLLQLYPSLEEETRYIVDTEYMQKAYKRGRFSQVDSEQWRYYPECDGITAYLQGEHDVYAAMYQTLINALKRPKIEVAKIPYASPTGFAIMGYCVQEEDAGKIYTGGLHTTELRYIFNDYYFEGFKDVLMPYIRCYGDFYWSHRIITCLLQPRYAVLPKKRSGTYGVLFMRGAASFMFLCMYNKDLANCILKILESLIYAKPSTTLDKVPSYIKARHELELAYYQNIYNYIEFLDSAIVARPWYSTNGKLYYESGARFSDAITYYPTSLRSTYGNTFASFENNVFMGELYLMLVNMLCESANLEEYAQNSDCVFTESFMFDSWNQKSSKGLTLEAVENSLKEWAMDKRNKVFDIGFTEKEYIKTIHYALDVPVTITSFANNIKETLFNKSANVVKSNRPQAFCNTVIQYLTRWNLYVG